MAEASAWRGQPWIPLLIVASLVPCVAALWSVDYMPMLDGPKHAYVAHVRAHLSEPWYSAHFEETWPVTYFGFALVYAALERVLAWKDALRVALTLIVVAWCVSVTGLARAMHPRRWPLAVAAYGAAIQWPLLMGFFNYIASGVLGLGALALGLAKTEWSVRRELGVAALLVIACAFHPFGAQFAGLTLVVALLPVVPRSQWIRRLGSLFLMLTPGMLVTFVTSEEVNETRLRVALEGGKTTVMLPLLERLENFGLCFAGGPAWRAWPLVLLALSGVGWSLLAMARQRKIAAIELSVAVLSLAMAALALALPFHGEAWQFFSPRFIPIALLTGLVLVPVERLGPRAYAVFAGCALVYNVASNAWMVGQLRDRRARTAEALAGLGRPVTPGRTMLPIIFNANATDDVLADPRTLQPPYVQPLHNLGDIYAIDRNAVVAYAFASMRTAAPVISRDDAFPPVPARDYRAAFARHPSGPIRQYELARLGLYGARFDDIVFYGTEADAAWLIDAGYEAEFWRGALLIAHFKGCDGTLRISGAPEGVRLSVGTGWGPFDRPGWFDNLPGHPEMEAIRLQRLPCGSAWVRVVPSDGALRCEHADETGTLVVRLPRSEPIECRLVRR